MVNEFFPARKLTEHDYGAGSNAKSTYRNLYFYSIFFFKSLANPANSCPQETRNQETHLRLQYRSYKSQISKLSIIRSMLAELAKSKRLQDYNNLMYNNYSILSCFKPTFGSRLFLCATWIQSKPWNARRSDHFCKEIIQKYTCLPSEIGTLLRRTLGMGLFPCQLQHLPSTGCLLTNSR